MTPTRARSWIRALAVTGVLGFLAIVIVEHFADGSLDPARHEISEYVHGSLGWLMTVGFAIWSAALAATSLYTAGMDRGRPVGGALLAAAAGVLITACFATPTSAGRLPPGVSLSTSGRLHDIGSGLATIAVLAAALLSLRIPRRVLRRMTISVVSFAVSSDLALLAVGNSVGGIRERLLVAAGCAWQLTLLGCTSRPGHAGKPQREARGITTAAPHEQGR